MTRRARCWDFVRRFVLAIGVVAGACPVKPAGAEPLARPPVLPDANPEAGEQPLPINLAAALQLAGVRPTAVAAAEASVATAAAQLTRARVAWLPNFNLGSGYYHHDGATQGQSGNFYINSKDQYLAGGGLYARLDTSKALFGPLAARQVLRSREIAVQAAKNDALLAVAEAYFNVQQARGRLTGTLDVLGKAQELVQKVRQEAREELDPTDVHRARTTLAEIEQALATQREQWRTASADLTEVLGLDPAAVVTPEEPPPLRVTLVSLDEPLERLVALGLTNRPELASQQALVQAALARVRQEKARPLAPSVVVQGGSNPADAGSQLMGGVYGSGAHGSGNPWSARDDVAVGLVWGLDNLGFGNRAQVRERQAEQQQAAVELTRIERMVASEVVRARAQLVSAVTRCGEAEKGLQEAERTYRGTLDELGKITKVDDVKVLVRRAFEVIIALQALLRAYDNYFTTAGDYNRAQFRLYRALGCPPPTACARPAP